MEKDLVIIAGRNEDAVGKPLIYATSKSFMDYFGINSSEELPKISEVMMEEFEKATVVKDIIANNEAAEAEETLLSIEQENEITEPATGTEINDEVTVPNEDESLTAAAEKEKETE